MDNFKEFFIPLTNPPSLSSNKDLFYIESSIYTQNRKRFIIGLLWEFFFCFVLICCFVIGIGCLATADQENGDNEWLQITTGILIIIVVIPIIIGLLIYLPHIFISCIKIKNNEILLPKRILLLRKYISFYDINELSIDVNGSVIVHGKHNYHLGENIINLSQLLWYIHNKYPKIKCDEFVLRRISKWESGIHLETSSFL